MQVGIFGGAEYPRTGLWPASPGECDVDKTIEAWEQGLEIYELADSLGFDHVSVAEHHYSSRLDPNPLLTAAVLTQRLKTARITVLGRTVPLANPVQLAEELAMLDVICKGRLEVALLRGTPNECITYYSNPVESRAILSEAVELIRTAWTEPEPFGWEGKHYQFRTIAVMPRPVQPGGPALLLSANSEASARMAGEHQASVGISYTELNTATELIAVYKQAANQAGWTPAPANILYRNYAYVADTDAEAEQQSQEFGYGNPASAFLPRHRGFGEAYGEIFGASYTLRAPTAKPRFCGSPTTVIEQIREFQDAGFGRIDLTFTGSGLPYELGKRNLELFAHEVLPAVHEFSTAANAVV